MTEPGPPASTGDPADGIPATNTEPRAPQTVNPPPFAPIFTLVTDSTTRTTHHPQVHYIFSDDDPDLLTQALAGYQKQDATDEPTSSTTDPNSKASRSRAVLLDLVPNPTEQGGYKVSHASSLSPSWAVLSADLSHISPASSESDGNAGDAEMPAEGFGDRSNGRLMLRIEGLESDALAGDVDVRQLVGSGSASGSGSGSGGVPRDPLGLAEPEDYTGLVDEFEKRMSLLRKVVDAGEERRKLVEPVGDEQAHNTEDPGDELHED